jgi:hypothetical protein
MVNKKEWFFVITISSQNRYYTESGTIHKLNRTRNDAYNYLFNTICVNREFNQSKTNVLCFVLEDN